MAVSLDRAAVAEVRRVLARDRQTMPLAETLVRHLGSPSWLLTFGDDGRLRAVTVLGEQLASRPAPVTVRAPPPAVSPLERTFALTPGGALARRVGAAAATGRQLADLALREDDPELRAEAVHVAVEAAMKDPALERTLVAALDGIDDLTLAQGLANIAGEGAAGLVSLVAEQARGRPLGRRATQLLPHLERGP